MSLFLITGSAGSGKSEVYLELKLRGYIAFDTDDDGLARWQNKTTAFIHPKSSIKSHMRTPSFLKDHWWVIPTNEMDDIQKKAVNSCAFICGSVANEDKLRKYFDKVFALQVSDDMLRDRLLTRTTNDWGKQPHELELTISKNKRELEIHKKFGDIIIDGSFPVAEVVDKIVSKI